MSTVPYPNVTRARLVSSVALITTMFWAVAARAEAPDVGERQVTQIPSRLEMESAPPMQPRHAFAELSALPEWLKDLLTPQGREALGLMRDFFSGAVVQRRLDENESIRGGLFDIEPRRRNEAARVAGDRSNKLNAAARQRAFQRFRAIAQNRGSVRVIVKLEVPGIDALTAQSVTATGSNVATAADANLTQAIRAVADRELANLAGTVHTIHHKYAFIPYVALDASEAALTALEQSPAVIDIEKDLLARPMLNKSTKQIGADVTRDEGFDGSGVYVAVFDSGARTSHEAFSGKDIIEACFATSASGTGGDCPNGSNVDTMSSDAARPYSSEYSGYDHGTHVAGIACGMDPDGAQLVGGQLQPNKGLCWRRA